MIYKNKKENEKPRDKSDVVYYLDDLGSRFANPVQLLEEPVLSQSTSLAPLPSLA